MFNSDNGGFFMPVAPAGGGYGNGIFGGDGGVWLILIFALLFGGWGGGFGGFGGVNNLAADGAMLYPWMNQAEITTNGFSNQALNTSISGIQSAINTGFGDTALGIAGLNQAICQNGNATVAAVNGAQNAITQQMYSNQIADMERSFSAQTASTQGMSALQSQLAQCCCDNRLATAQTQALVQSENCADRAVLSDGIRDILAATQAQTQIIIDKMCQDKIDAKNEKIAELQNQLNMQNLAASRAAQTADLVADNTAQTQYIVNRVAPYPVPAYQFNGFGAYANGFGCGCNG